jgi:hypothetical protein
MKKGGCNGNIKCLPCGVKFRGGKLRKPCRDIRKVDKCFDPKPKKPKREFNQTVKGKLVSSLQKIGVRDKEIEEVKKLKNEELIDILNSKLTECGELMRRKQIDKAILERETADIISGNMEEERELENDPSMPVFPTDFEDIKDEYESEIKRAEILDEPAYLDIDPSDYKEYKTGSTFGLSSNENRGKLKDSELFAFSKDVKSKIRKVGKLRRNLDKVVEAKEKERFFRESEMRKAQEAKSQIRKIGKLRQRLNKAVREEKVREEKEREPISSKKRKVFKIRDPEIKLVKDKFKKKGITISWNNTKQKWSADYTAPFVNDLIESGFLKPIIGKARPGRTIIPEMIGKPTIDSLKQFIKKIDKAIKLGKIFSK